MLSAPIWANPWRSRQRRPGTADRDSAYTTRPRSPELWIGRPSARGRIPAVRPVSLKVAFLERSQGSFLARIGSAVRACDDEVALPRPRDNPGIQTNGEAPKRLRSAVPARQPPSPFRRSDSSPEGRSRAGSGGSGQPFEAEQGGRRGTQGITHYDPGLAPRKPAVRLTTPARARGRRPRPRASSRCRGRAPPPEGGAASLEVRQAAGCRVRARPR